MYEKVVDIKIGNPLDDSQLYEMAIEQCFQDALPPEYITEDFNAVVENLLKDCDRDLPDSPAKRRREILTKHQISALNGSFKMKRHWS